MAEEEQVTESNDAPAGGSIAERLQGRGPLVAAIIFMAAGLLFICFFGYLLLDPFGDDDADVDADDGTPFATTVPIGVNESLVVGISDNSVISITLDSPITLDVVGRQFNLQRQSLPPNGNWQPLSVDEGQGIWVYGSVINYIIGLPDNDANRLLLASLTTEDEMSLLTQKRGRLPLCL